MGQIMKISGNKLKQKRNLQGLSQQELGNLLGGLNKATVSNWEQSKKPIPIKYLEPLKNIFHCLSEDLLKTSSIKDETGFKQEYTCTTELENIIYELEHWQAKRKEYQFTSCAIEKFFNNWTKERIDRLQKEVDNFHDEMSGSLHKNKFVVTDYLRSILVKIIQKYDGIDNFSKSVYISVDTFRSWLNEHKNSVISDDLWRRILPYAWPYLTDELSEFYTHEEIRHAFHDENTWLSAGQIAYYNLPEKWVGKFIMEVNELKKGVNSASCGHHSYCPGCFKPVPVVPADLAEAWNCTVTSFVEFIASLKDDYAYFPNAQPDDIAIKIIDDSLKPSLPKGSYVLIRPNAMPVTGNRVAVKLKNGNILFRLFVDNGDSIDLQPINDEKGKKITFKKRESFAHWIWPIKISITNEGN